MKNLYKIIHLKIQSSLNGIVSAIDRLVRHDGSIDYSKLYMVNTNNNNYKISRGINPNHEFSHLSIMIGGEVPNSICTMYEVSYFIQALIISTSATYVFSQYSIFDLNTMKSKNRIDKIHSCLKNISYRDIEDNIKNPLISIVISLDTDIEPYRYVKHHLWGINKEYYRLRCCEITSDYFNSTGNTFDIHDRYNTKTDQLIAKTALDLARDLAEAKAIQYSIALSKVLNLLGVSLSYIPLYFNKVPKEEIAELPKGHSYISALAELHEPENIKKYSKIVKRKQPWIISLPCPACGESSKKIINSRLKNRGKTIRSICSSKSKYFRNEIGQSIIRHGCGNIFEFEVPRDPKELHEFLNKNSFTLNFPARDLLGVIKSTVYQPAIWIVTDIGVGFNIDNQIFTIKGPTGYGDHLQMLISTTLLHKMLIDGDICSKTHAKLLEEDDLVSNHVYLYGNTSPISFVDRMAPVVDYNGIYASDTSIFAFLEHGNIEEIMEHCIDVNYFNLVDLVKYTR